MRNLLSIILIFGLLSAEPHQKAIQSANEIIRAFSEKSSKQHISDDLRNIARYGHSLPGNVQRELKILGFNFDGPIVNRSLDARAEADGLDKTFDTGMFRFHYTLTGSNAVDLLDSKNTNIPDYVEEMADVFNYVVMNQLSILGFVEPPGDGWYPTNNDNGGSGLYDVYIRDAGYRVYGYVQPEYFANNTGNNENSSGVNEVNAMTSYMVMRHNYDGFPNTSLENIQVTAAHEFFHAIQFGYDGWEESWVLEATAVQMEEMVYDDINDCYQYMPSWFQSPHQSLNLDSDDRWYGSYIFFEYVTSHLSSDALLAFWEKSITHDSYYGEYSIQTLDESFTDMGSSFSEMLNQMSIANRVLSSSAVAEPYTYDEANAYSISPSTFKTVSYTAGTNDTVISTNLQANAAQYIRLISSDPVLVTLMTDGGSSTDLELHAILSYGDSAWTVWSGGSINIDPSSISIIYLAVVSQNPEVSDFGYSMLFKDGETSVDSVIPDHFSISNAFPNPFNPETHILIDIPNSDFIHISIYDLQGRLVKMLADNHFNSGEHLITWNGLNNRGKRVASGTYFIRVKGENQENWQKITLLK